MSSRRLGLLAFATSKSAGKHGITWFMVHHPAQANSTALAAEYRYRAAEARMTRYQRIDGSAPRL